jgi:hypothetical protein
LQIAQRWVIQYNFYKAPQNGQHRARFDWGFGAICFAASPVAAVFESAPGSATPPEHRPQTNMNFPSSPSKPDISTRHRIGHFYLALTACVGLVVSAVLGQVEFLVVQRRISSHQHRPS